MKTLDIAVAPAGTVATLMTFPNDDVSTYVIFVRQWTNNGPVPVTIWHFDELEGAGGASLTLDGPATGYDFILQALVRPQAQAAIQVSYQLAPPGGNPRLLNKPVTLPSGEGPVVEREWKVVLR